MVYDNILIGVIVHEVLFELETLLPRRKYNLLTPSPKKKP